MDRPSGYIATFTGSVYFRRTVHRQRHLAAQNDVCGLFHVRVIRVVCVWPVFPNISIAKAFVTQLLHQRLLVHAAILPKSKSLTGLSARYSLPTTRYSLLFLS
jgi:hypothetical protein